jgi:hypothetical protein
MVKTAGVFAKTTRGYNPHRGRVYGWTLEVDTDSLDAAAGILGHSPLEANSEPYMGNRTRDAEPATEKQNRRPG